MGLAPCVRGPHPRRLKRDSGPGLRKVPWSGVRVVEVTHTPKSFFATHHVRTREESQGPTRSGVDVGGDTIGVQE